MTAPNPLPSESPKRKKTVLGPGTLVLGSVGTQLDLSCQVTEITIGAEGDSEDPEYTLCGDTVAGERTYTWTMNVTAFQDLEADGVIDFTWKHAGKEMPFKFVPDSAGTAAVTGRVIIDPVQIGGKVRQKNTSEAEWQLAGAPNFNPNATAATVAASPGATG
ncbi:hypothetical protein [Corynebacterium heidelbergense]|uniref:Phage tail protein n=1 Tax=Corynebacterium heidelbergense TaxID=2055947 RepID=A0A364VA52_9CORY|nr:hypothetical protein [Corynebacterium heidelbergense]RAV33532.1 hypothetical protein CWC39_07960 [Corynebacterium heidelbergense]WCZ36169.1 hypothetical protein CHEID_03045 [Corynebacterium heidelbergense]WCZ37624.1 hypothetical protein CHEID_10535 [Corynebacterium heidelbergense]